MKKKKFKMMENAKRTNSKKKEKPEEKIMKLKKNKTDMYIEPRYDARAYLMF